MTDIAILYARQYVMTVTLEQMTARDLGARYATIGSLDFKRNYPILTIGIGSNIRYFIIISAQMAKM